MSYHGLGQLLPFAPIERSTVPVSQPTSTIVEMEPIVANPLIESTGFEEGDRAMIQEMQARTGTQPVEKQEYDPTAFQQPEVRPTLTRSYEPVSSGEASTRQPVESIVTEGPSVNVPMSTHPVIGTSTPTGTIEKYAPETGLFPAQPSEPVGIPDAQLKLMEYCESVKGSMTKSGCMVGGKLVTSLPPHVYHPQGPITEEEPPPAGQIPQGTPPTGQIPQGTPSQGPIPLQYQQQQAAAAAAQQAKSPVVSIALAAGAALLLSRLL